MKIIEKLWKFAGMTATSEITTAIEWRPQIMQKILRQTELIEKIRTRDFTVLTSKHWLQLRF